MIQKKKLMLGNEAIARGLLENGCAVATSYPGTPASEILSSLAALQKKHQIAMHSQWAVNEKVALEIAYAAAICGLRSAVSMKQVGLNVASDPLMSAAYMGNKGGFIVISADDPGPHSSQTEQDSRMMAMTAKIPVLDPDSPEQAGEMTGLAFEMSETFEIPVMIRPTTRICHSRQAIVAGQFPRNEKQPVFEKNPARWAATPKFRHQLHGELDKKMALISGYEKTAPLRLNPNARAERAIVVSGVAAAHVKEILQNLKMLWNEIPLYQVIQPFPLHAGFITHLRDSFQEILVIEETMPVIEMQIADRSRVRGKMSGAVPCVGELTPESIEDMIRTFAGLSPQKNPIPPAVPGRRPTLCAGCPHRAAFFAIRKAAPKGIYTSDIGCYTLGLNLGAVDTVLCMGAAVSQAAGFYHAFKGEKKRPDIVATLGDSTFFHAGIPPLIDAFVQNVRFVLVILDNRTTAMTGSQPTPACGRGACGEALHSADIESLVRGCGISFCKVGDPYRTDEFIQIMKEALRYSRETGPAVVISRHPCLLDRREEKKEKTIRVRINENCDACGYCLRYFECPALYADEKEEKTKVDPLLCSGCGVCLHVCPKHAIEEVL